MALTNAFQIVAEFERRVAEFAGSKYAVAVDSCTNALFLCFEHEGIDGVTINCPAHTYVSVPMAIINAGGRPAFKDIKWVGAYVMPPARVVDGAKRFRRGMFEGGLHCLSFHAKKHLNIGRGGIILTDDEAARDWLKLARYDGRPEAPYGSQDIKIIGHNFYMQPEQAARGLQLMDIMPRDGFPDLTEDYPDLRKFSVFKDYL